MRILKGYSKDEQRDLENNKEFVNCNDFINTITSNRVTTECCSIKDKYHKADTDERISIIRDILDFYTDKAKFPEQKYYVQLIKNNNSSYLNKCSPNGFYMPDSRGQDKLTQTQFTEQEIKDIDPRYMAFTVPVEEDDE